MMEYMLDDMKSISEVDKSGMLDIVAQFPEHIKDAVDLTRNSMLPSFIKIDNVVISGMGASAISGDITRVLLGDKVDVPIFVNRDYDLPKWVRKDTLAIFFSYSGNTEETLSSFKNAYQKKCKIICISSGGKLQELSEKREVPHLKIPSGFQPRAATAYLLFPLLLITKKTGLLRNTIESDIEETISVVKELVKSNNKSVPEVDNPSKQIAKTILGTTPQIYGWGVYSPIATRWRHQLNENSKILAYDSFVSECNHNDIVGWSLNPEAAKNHSVILFRDKNDESIYMSTRLDFMKTLYNDVAANVLEIQPKGKSRLAKMMHIMCLGDFTSCYLAVLRKIDPTPVEVIIELKKRLASL